MNSYDLAAVRELLAAAFSASEISTLAFDLFQPIYQEFTPGMISSEKIRMIVAHADQQGEISRLLAYVEKHNPYQYQRFAERLRPITSKPIPDSNQSRRQILEGHIQQREELRRQYENKMAIEENPRRTLAWQQEIERETAAIADYQRQLEALGAPPEPVHPLPSLTDEKLDAIKQQIKTMEARLTGGQVNIMAHLVKLDNQQHTHYMALTQRLDKHQVELVDLLLDAADQQQIAQWDAASLTLMTQQALVDLHHLRQNQPDAAQWQSLIALLGQDATWDQKLKWTLPLIPGILTYESEATLDILPTLREAWERLRNRVKK